MATSQTGMTFNELQTDIQNYLERGASAAVDPIVYQQIPRLITLAERRIIADLKIEGFIVASTTTFPAGISVYAKPDRWRVTISINIGTGTGHQTRTPVFPRSYEYVRNYWPDESQTGQPKFYADYNYNNWVICPTPDQDYPAEILYYELPALLSDTNQTNWITEYAPQLVLYGALLEATPFLKNDERIPVWKQFYSEAVSAINTEDLRRIVDRSTTRTEA